MWWASIDVWWRRGWVIASTDGDRRGISAFIASIGGGGSSGGIGRVLLFVLLLHIIISGALVTFAAVTEALPEMVASVEAVNEDE